MVPPTSHKVSRVRCYSGATRPSSDFAYRTVTFFGLSFQTASAIRFLLCEWSATPHRSVVWALPLSLAATQEIDVSFSSSGYLDVSVPRVPFMHLWIHFTVRAHYRTRVSPFGYLRVAGCLHLTAAFRSLPRPSSAPIAKAFPLCSFSLDLAECSSDTTFLFLLLS